MTTTPDPVETMRALFARAVEAHQRGRFEDALTGFDEALPLLRDHGCPADLATCLANRASCLHSLGRFEEALTSFDEALPIARTHGGPNSLALCLMNRSTCLRSLGLFEKALTGYDEALLLLRDHGLPADLARCLMTRAGCLSTLGRLEEAITNYDEALPLFRDHGLPADLVACLRNRATCLVKLRRDEDALPNYHEALSLSRRHGLSVALAHCLMNRATYLQSLGRPEEAFIDYDEALPLFRDHGSPAEFTYCRVNRATCLADLSRHEEALSEFDEALLIFQQDKLYSELTACLMNRATCLTKLGRFKEALTAYDEAFTAEDRSATMLQDPTHRTSARRESIYAHRTAVRLALRQAQRGRAWEYVQHAKGRTLTDLLTSRANLSALDHQELLLAQQYDTGQIGQDAFTAARDHFVAQREAQHQARLGTDPRVPVPLNDVITALQPGEALLDVFTMQDDGSLALFLLCPDQPTVTWTHVVDGTALQPLVERWHTARTIWTTTMTARARLHGSYPGDNPSIVTRRNRLRTHYTATIAAAEHDETVVLAELGDLLLTPVLAHLDETVTTLIISPDGLLHQLPLAALTVAGDDGQLISLIDHLDLQLIPSATSLAILRGPHGPRLTWPPALLAAAPFATKPNALAQEEETPSVSPPDDTTDGPTPGISPLDDRAIGVPRSPVPDAITLADLPESGPEIDAVATLLTAAGSPATRLPRTEATRTRLEAALPAAHVLHLATHGGILESGETVMDYRIFLADHSAVQVRELYDGAVSLQDVFLVTLSACSLGQVLQQGAEALGFVQAFLQAGAGVVLAPLWDVYDLPTRLLMEHFYAELVGEEHPTMATAWRKAANWLRNETKYSHPVFWAGFLPSGDAALRLTPPTV